MAPGINSLTYAMFAIASDVMNPQQTAAAIRQLRARLNLSQEELAARLNVSYATINRWEAGKSKPQRAQRSEEHTSELQSLMRISYAVFCLKKKTHKIIPTIT